MRKIILGFLFVLWSVSEAKARLLSLEQAQKHWQDFLGCSKFSAQENEFLRCTDNQIASVVIKPVKNKMRQFLDQGFMFSNLHICTTADLIQPIKAAKGEEAFCFKLEGLNSESYGYVSFIREKSSFKIQEIKFKY